jgi:hypothetical protein
MRNENLVKSMDGNISLLFGFIGSIKNDEIMKRKESDGLSAYDHICHLSLIQPLLYERLETLVEKENPVISLASLRKVDVMKGVATQSIMVLMRTFESWRKKQVDLVNSTHGLLWDKKAANRELENYTLEACVREILLNDIFHINQIEELVAINSLD